MVRLVWRQGGADMRRHVVRAFGHVAEVDRVFGNEVLKEVAHVERDIGIAFS